MSTTPDALDRFGVWLAERTNPIVVKEVRQGLRQRLFVVFFTLMLVSCVVISLIAFAASDGNEPRAGQVTFGAYFFSLGAVEFFIIPYSAYRSMAREREDETWVLLTLTGLGPRRILAGKILSFVLQGFLYMSAAAPFLIFSYFLNGIDLPTILVVLLLTSAFHVFLVSVLVSAATLAEARITRALMHFVVLGGLLQAVGGGIGMGIVLTELTKSWSFSSLETIAALAAVYFFVTTALLLFEAAASRLSLSTEPYAKGPRLAFLSQVVAIAGFFAWAALVDGRSPLLAVGAVVLAAYLAFFGTAISADLDGMSKVHWSSAAARWNLLKPGALRGYVLTLLCLLAALVLALVPWVLEPAGFTDEEVVPVASLAVLYIASYLAASHVLARVLPGPPSQVGVLARLMALMLATLGTGVPPLLGAFADDPAMPVLNVFNPIIGLVIVGQGKETGIILGVNAVVAVVLTLTALVLLRVRDKEPLT